MSGAPSESWLEPFVERLHAAGRTVLDLGCGPGQDAAYLVARGFAVVGCDRLGPGRGVDEPRAAFVRSDLRWPPFRAASFDVAVASLSLHYFPWDETVAAFRGTADLLRSRGVLLFRVNASDDVEHGAGQGKELEPGFFRMPSDYHGWSQTKRFFDEQMVRGAVPAGLQIERLAHRTIHLQAPKRVWECLAVRAE